MDKPSAQTETELKFALDGASLGAFKALPFLADAPRTDTHLVADYFDTEDHALHRAGYSLRLRRAGERRLQTLKGRLPGTGSLFRRSEIETEVDGAGIDQAALAAALPPELHAAVSGRLAVRFSVEVDRSEWLVRHRDGLVAVSCDQGAIRAGPAGEALVEVEFELKDGRASAVFALARAAVAGVALHIEPLAKSDRGYRLLCPAPDAPDDDWPALDADGPVDAGLRRLADALANEVAGARRQVMEQVAVEPVHRMRVLLRRLRSLLDFAEAMTGRHFDGVAQVVRDGFRQLGAVRDLDILAAAVPQNAAEAEQALGRIARERARELERARRILASRRFAAAMLELLAFAEAMPPDEDSAAGPLREAARRLLRRQWRALRRMPDPGDMTARRRHRFRIRAKTFRFTTDIFGGVFAGGKAPKRRRKMNNALRDLQDVLGRLNDRRNVEQLAESHLGRSVAASLGLAGPGRALTEDLSAADKARRRLLGRKAFWR